MINYFNVDYTFLLEILHSKNKYHLDLKSCTSLNRFEAVFWIFLRYGRHLFIVTYNEELPWSHQWIIWLWLHEENKVYQGYGLSLCRPHSLFIRKTAAEIYYGHRLWSGEVGCVDRREHSEQGSALRFIFWCEHVCICECRCSRYPEGGVGFPWSWDVCATGNQMQIVCKSCAHSKLAEPEQGSSWNHCILPNNPSLIIQRLYA